MATNGKRSLWAHRHTTTDADETVQIITSHKQTNDIRTTYATRANQLIYTIYNIYVNVDTALTD